LASSTTGAKGGPLPQDIEQLRVEARYWRERRDLLRAKSYSGRPVRASRLRELERTADGAEARLKQAEASVANPTTQGRDHG
jgi:hypothetical protein